MYLYFLVIIMDEQVSICKVPIVFRMMTFSSQMILFLTA